MISPGAATAQIPWRLAAGAHKAVLFRAGAASNVLDVSVWPYAPGIFPGAAVRAGAYCQVNAENGVRPGELLEVYATGLGAGSSQDPMTEAFVNGIPAEVLYSGMAPGFAGLNQVNIRVSPLTPPADSAGLELRIGGAASNSYPLRVASPFDPPGISLKGPVGEILLQAGGPAAPLEVEVEGANAYCGPVLFSLAQAPQGISFRAAVAFTGGAARLELWATASARAQSSTLLLYGHAPGAASGVLSLRVTVLPSLGAVPVRVVSGGYRSYPLAQFVWGGQVLFSAGGGGPGRGINVLAVDSAKGVFSPVRSFDTWGDPTASSRLVEYLNSLPAGVVAMFAAADDGSLLLSKQARAAIAAMFGSRLIGALGYQQSWALIGRKGGPPLAEGASLTTQIVLDRTLVFPQ